MLLIVEIVISLASSMLISPFSGFDDRFYSFRFSRNLNFCIDLIKNNCKIIIAGNHDLNHLRRLPSYNGVFSFPANWYDITAEERKFLSKGKVWLYDNDEPINCFDKFNELLAENKDKYLLEIDGINILLTHSISPDISGIIAKKPNRYDDFAQHLQLLTTENCTIGISGHLHPNGLLRIDEKKIYNPKFSELELPHKGHMQFICPCIADGMQDNGYTVLDSNNRTIESYPLRTPRNNLYLL